VLDQPCLSIPDPREGGLVGRWLLLHGAPRAKLAKEASGPESGIVIRGSNKTVL